MSRYLITGCAGFIGSHLAEAVLDRGDEVVGVDAFTDYYPRPVKDGNVARLHRRPGFQFLEADLSEGALDGFVGTVDGIFHLAAQPGVRGSWGESFEVYARDNILVTQRLFEAAARHAIRVVWASSSSVYGDAERYPTPETVQPRPISPYGVTKLTCESLATAYHRSTGLESVALRYFTVYGPRQRPDMAFARILDALFESRPFRMYGSGEQTRDVTYISDAVAATLAAMERGRARSVYNIGGGSEVSLRDAVALVEGLTGKSLQIRHEDSARGDVRRTSADTSTAAADLDWTPHVSLEDGLTAQVEDYSDASYTS